MTFLMELGIAPQQVEINASVGIAGQNELAGVSKLRNVRGDVDSDDASQASHVR
ncbi:MAG: hypothetical protein LAN83_19060 [Acidobacteriia bacterium]|nr:hypothetical protein [Terriglobia bacterium]